VTRRRLVGLLLATVAVFLLAHPPVSAAARVSPAIAISPLPLPSPIVSLPLPVIPPIGISPSPGVPSPGVPTPVASPLAARSPAPVVPAAPRPTAVAFAPGAGAGTVDKQPPAQPAPPPGDSVIRAVVASVPSQVPVFPVLLPLLAGLVVLLFSAALAAYRRTQEAKRYARLERTKSDFMKLASHELRTPLTVLRGYISMIRDGDIRPATPDFARAFPIIEDRLNQVHTIVEQMLEAARLEEGEAILNLEMLDLADLAANSVEGIRVRAAGAHPIEYREPAGHLNLLCDRTRVAAMFDQLLDNAVKYSPAGGEIECSLAEREGRAVFVVRDSGVGIAPEDLGRLFTRFGRLVTRDNSHIPGAGLGLYLAREHARRMGGDITVESRPAQGSAFTLSLPLVAAPEREVAPRQ
jgi:signal transduction histidine kinase